jgi:CheY-like chemotaxis protein
MCTVGIAAPDSLVERTADIVEEPHGLRVLLAEDNPVNQRVAIALLRKHGHQVSVVSTGIEAVEAWEAGEFDVILTDNQMPGMGGLEVVHCIRAREAATGRTRTPVVALSASALIGDRERFLAAGMDAFLAKRSLLPTCTRSCGRWRRRGWRSIRSCRNNPSKTTALRRQILLLVGQIGNLRAGWGALWAGANLRGLSSRAQDTCPTSKADPGRVSESMAQRVIMYKVHDSCRGRPAREVLE